MYARARVFSVYARVCIRICEIIIIVQDGSENQRTEQNTCNIILLQRARAVRFERADFIFSRGENLVNSRLLFIVFSIRYYS